MESETALTLTDYLKLEYKYDIEQNTFKGNKKRYGVIPLSASVGIPIIGTLTYDHSFELILTDDFVDKRNDNDKDRVIKELSDRIEDMTVKFHQSLLGLPDVVILVELLSIDEPEIIDDHNVIAMRASFLVKYRNFLDC